MNKSEPNHHAAQQQQRVQQQVQIQIAIHMDTVTVWFQLVNLFSSFQNVVDAVRKFAPNGLSVWWETVREPDFDKAISLLAPHGRMVVMAGRDARPQFPVGPFYSKNCSLLGFVILNSSLEELRAAADDINSWMAAGKLKAQIDRVLSLSQAAEAHRLQEDSTIKKTSTLTGKIVLKLRMA